MTVMENFQYDEKQNERILAFSVRDNVRLEKLCLCDWYQYMIYLLTFAFIAYQFQIYYKLLWNKNYMAKKCFNLSRYNI